MSAKLKLYTDRKVINEQVISRRYFACPKCKHRYTIMVYDKAVKEDIKAYKKLVSKQKRLLSGKPSQQVLEYNLAEIENLSRTIQKQEENLKRLWLDNE